MADKEKALKLVDQRTAMIELLNNKLDKQVSASQKELLELIISDFVDQLETDGGKITNSAKNQRLVALLDKTFATFNETQGPAMVKTMVDAIQNIASFNNKYFGTFEKPANLVPINKRVISSVSDWLGITSEGGAAKNGYLDTLVKADQVRQQVKDLAFGKVANQAGLFETRKVIKDLLTEDAAGDKALGGLQKYYRNFTYDLYSKVDRTAAKMTADKLELKYAIYEGGLIKTSRKFCIERNGKVFTTDEIAEFDPPEAKQPDYNPATDLGGYGCRHHLNYIPYAVAVALRPDLKVEPTAKAEEKPVEQVVPVAKTTQEAHDWAKTNLKANVDSYKGYSVDVANQINKSLYQVEKSFKVVPSVSVASKVAGKAYADYDWNTNEINFRKTYKDLEGRLKENNEQWNKRYKNDYTVAKDLDGIIKHEYGHAFDNHNGRVLYKELEALPLDIRNKLYGISGYASSDRFQVGNKTQGAEMIAEVIAAKLTGNPKYASLPEEARTLIDKYFN